MGDFEKLINASDLIEWIMETYPDWCEGAVRSIVDHVEHMPSAQPDTDEWCHDCKEYDKEHHCCPRWNRVIRTTLEEAQPDKAYEKGWEDGREALRKEIWENERDRRQLI